ncbi:hypothetical protein HRbin22_00994 [Candidatus Thermoflexus japonica]|uniref:Uncharacterized protein n=1 Tax=Candidatus Thermoflexus japonica TaxID=2035417 RepID=A0A2H5Y5N1_9CHLR|nr:hypothetical protein HRbin22_00994 [Candidatus Thermoflexus japonica]
MIRKGRTLSLAAVLLLAVACTTPPSPAGLPEGAPEAFSQGESSPPPSPIPATERGSDVLPLPPTAAPAGVAAPGKGARQIYTAFRTVPSPCCPPRPLPEILERLRGFPGILDVRLEGGRMVVD